MVDTEGPVEVASQASSNQRGEMQKVEQTVFELTRYGVSVGALQETKWFGDAVYEVNGGVLLAAGRPTLADGVTIQRGEGVLWCCWVMLWLLGNLVANSGVHGVKGVFWRFWSCQATPHIVLLCTYLGCWSAG